LRTKEFGAGREEDQGLYRQGGISISSDVVYSVPMQTIRSVQLLRDCPAVQIPAGHAVTLPRGTTVDITQSLGGSHTVQTGGGLFRVDGRDADALGLDVEPVAPAVTTGAAAGSTDDLEQQVWETLKSCFDPEIPVNIVDLGLIYDLTLEPSAENGHRVSVKMTLTAPGCGMGQVIAADAQAKILGLPGVAQADVEIVWDPPWHQSMISPAGRRVLGLE
jgi:probable FeS assembly SUF system protein SufT